MSLKRWKKIEDKVFHDNGFWTYKVDKFQIEGGEQGDYHYVHTLGSSMVIPIIGNKTTFLLNQYRYLNQKESLEFPCGSVEKGLTPIENAQKEFREETGFKAGTLKKIGEFSPFTGASDEICHVYFAYDLEFDPLEKDSTEEFELIEYFFYQIDEMIDDNRIWDGMSIAAWRIAQKHIQDIENAK